MKIRLLCGAMVLSWCATVGCVQAGANIEDLKTQERAKREQLYVLGEKIKRLDEDTVALRSRLVGFAVAIVEAKRRQNPEKQMSEQDIKDALEGEGLRFESCFFDVANKTTGCIVSDKFFKDVENGTSYKFYLAKYIYDTYTLNEMLIEWEKLSDEMVAIKAQIEAIEGGL